MEFIVARGVEFVVDEGFHQTEAFMHGFGVAKGDVVGAKHHYPLVLDPDLPREFVLAEL